MSKTTGKYSRVIKDIAFALILLLCLVIANQVFQRKDNVVKYEQFYKEDEPFDILFFGSSRVLYTFQPMELWGKYGIRSYNMAQHSEGLGRDYWQLKNALEYNKPNLVVLDVSLFHGGYEVNEESEESRAGLHGQIDHMPMSKTKYEIVRELAPESLYLEYFSPFILYHNRWSQLTADDFYHDANLRYGADILNGIEPQERIAWSEEAYAEDFDPEAYNLDKMIALCREENIPLLFICMPCSENEGAFGTLNCFGQYFDSQDIPYLNIAKEEDFLDYEFDFSDSSHVNMAGGLKLTDYIGKYYIDHYRISQVSEQTGTKWDQAYAKYKEYKEEIIVCAKDNPELLKLAVYADSDYVMEEEQSQIRVFRQGESEPFVVYGEADGK